MTVVYIVRHGQTEWSLLGRHTSVTDLPLTAEGRRQAEVLRDRLHPSEFGLVLSSPRSRSMMTAELAGFPCPVIDDDLREWDYGRFEGMTAEQIRSQIPNWRIWDFPVPDGEQAEDVLKRLSRVVERVRSSGVEKAICFGHGHALRVLAMAWIGVDISHGGAFPLSTGSLSVLGSEGETPAIIRWNL